ncbi:MAG: UDP-N-acetylglucosamine--undecaprenyl-phosphate N-acetylglucosaminephosphotransferase [Enterobacteriaceae bacterium]
MVSWLNTGGAYLAVFLFSLLFLLVMRKIAERIGLVDKPNYRKRHQGAIPLVGGISVYAGICFYLLLIAQHYITHTFFYLTCAGILVLVGALDDRFDISVKFRASIQALIALLMMFGANLYLRHLGHLLGPWEFSLGLFGYVITLLAVWAAINAFNMVDGIDGLLGGVSCVSFAAMAVLLMMHGQPAMAAWCVAIIAALLPYCMLNLELFGRKRKVFMGDAGSTLLGFTIIWLLLQGTQTIADPIYPVTALWIIALPLMDMIAIMYRRLRKGMSPFAADRQHIHHLLMRGGFSARQSFIIITLASALLAAIGVVGDAVLHLPEWLMLALFLLAFMLYGYSIKRAWRVARYIRRLKRRFRRHAE